MEIDLDQADAREGAGLHVLNVAGLKEKLLEPKRDGPLHLRRTHPFVERSDRHHRNVDLGEDVPDHLLVGDHPQDHEDRKSTRLNSSHSQISYAVFCLKKKKKNK